jgi:hypothetical protein
VYFQHRDAVAVDAAVDVNHEIAAARLDRHRGNPFVGLALIQLHAQTSGGFDHAGDGVGALDDLVRRGA